MNKYILLYLLMCLSLAVSAQKCKYLSNTTSGLDGTRQIITEPLVFTKKSEAGELKIWAKLHQDSMIVIAFTLNTGSSGMLYKNETIKIQIGENEGVNITVMHDVKLPGNKERAATIYGLVDRAQRDILTSSFASSVQIDLDTSSIVFRPDKPKQSNAFKQAIHCIEVNL